MKRIKPFLFFVLAGLALALACSQPDEPIDLLLINGKVLDGAGNPWFQRDIGIRGDKIIFVGNARDEGVEARETMDLQGQLVTPGLWDVHSHAAMSSEDGKKALPLLYQGITTCVLGIDGGGGSNVEEIFDGYRRSGIAVNVIRYVGHGAARGSIMGVADRAPTPDEMEQMKAYIEKGMEEGAVGLSTGLFYIPGYFAETDEVIELAKVAARYGGSYDTHDRDLGATYKGIGYLNSIREAIEIGETAGTPVIFSHFNAQGAHNYGRAPEGARLIDEARTRGVDVVAAQHVYTSTQSSLRAYCIPRWATVGGEDEMKKRFTEPESRARLIKEIPEMLEIRGGAEKLVFSDPRPNLDGKTLADAAQEWGIEVTEAVFRILSESNAGVMNRDLYDAWNTEFLARQEWMMTCTDGGTPEFGKGIVHPRSYGAFTRKLKEYVYNKELIGLPFAVRGMTSQAANFYRISNRGMIKEGYYADIAVFDESRIQDKATYTEPHQYSEGTVHVLVNGEFAFRDGRPTGTLDGRPLPRGAR